MDLHANILIKHIINYHSTSTYLRSIVQLLRRPNMDRIPTEKCHICAEEIVDYDNIRQEETPIPVRRVNCDGASKGPYILLEGGIPDYGRIFVPRYVNQGESFKLVK